jgi:hypothetical protein
MIMFNQYAKHTRSVALLTLLPVQACGSQSSNKRRTVKSFFYYFLLFTIILLVALPFAVNAIDENPAEIHEPLTPHDFAYGMPLSFSGHDALYQITLPLSVYQKTIRNDLGDLRVFNAQGEVVPHMLQLAESGSTTQAIFRELAFFPLHATTANSLDQLSVNVKRDAAGTVIDIGSKDLATLNSRVAGYLMDASMLKQAVQALQLEWTDVNNNYVGALQIEASDDLKNWNTIVQDAPLASLQFGGHSLVQKRIEFPARNARYLRLSWSSEHSVLNLSRITAELAGTHIETPLVWTQVKDGAVTDNIGEYQFDLGAHIPVQRIRMELPQINTLVQAGFYSKAHINDAWRETNSVILYKLRSADQELRNPDITVASNNNRYWLVRIDQKGGGLGDGMPKMQVGWQPQKLMFLTRGNAPFQIAYGSREIKPATFQLQSLLQKTTSDKAVPAIQFAQAGEPVVLGGDMRLEPIPDSLPLKKWILWAVLSMSVLLLGWMAYRLLQQMDDKK